MKINPYMLGILIGVVLWGSIYFITRKQDLTALQLCHSIAHQVKVQGDLIGAPKTAGFAYFSKHPKEKAAAKRQVASTLKGLPCSPP